MIDTYYEISNRIGLKLAIVSDVHQKRVEEVREHLILNKPEAIMIPGDLINGVTVKSVSNREYIINELIEILDTFTMIAPVFFSLGNHEKHFTPDELNSFKASKAMVLFDEFVLLTIADKCVFIGGLSSATDYENQRDQIPNLSFIDAFEKLRGYKILMCHHPEYYDKYLKSRNIDLIISGHAHGGQVRIGNHGLYAPGQGLFPKYTGGIHDGKLVVSRGVAGTEFFPRINNKPEIVYLQI